MPNASAIQSFTDLVAWQTGHALALAVYRATSRFPKTESFSLTDQMRRCAISITSNIAEGFSRRTKNDKTQFYYIALGSTTELQNQLMLSKDLKYIDHGTFKSLAGQTVHVSKLINGLLKSATTHT